MSDACLTQQDPRKTFHAVGCVMCENMCENNPIALPACIASTMQHHIYNMHTCTRMWVPINVILLPGGIADRCDRSTQGVQKSFPFINPTAPGMPQAWVACPEHRFETMSLPMTLQKS